MFRDKERYGQDPNVVIRSRPPTFDKPLKWQREAERGDRVGHDRLVFTCSWSDWFIEEADAWRDDAWAIVKACPLLTFQVLTKRADRIAGHLPGDWGAGYPNCWGGVSVEDQAAANTRIPEILETPWALRFLSVEPLLAPVDLARSTPCGYYCDESVGHVDHQFCQESKGNGSGIGWVIVGGESGNTTGKYLARPCNIDWVRSVVRQCDAAGVPCWAKQLGSRPFSDNLNPILRMGGYLSLKDPHGEDMAEFPEDLRVRQMPTVAEAGVP